MNNSLIIILTRKCYPCACSYCDVLKQDEYNFWDEIFKNKEYFDFNINKILKLLENFDSLRFFGWEVLLKKEVLKKIISSIRNKWFQKDIFVNTNLHLFEENDLPWLKENQVKVITSLNGDEILHCKTRGVAKKDYQKLLKDIKNLKKNNIYVQINTVLFPYEKNFISKIEDILKLNPDKINLLPLMYSNLVNKKTIPDFLQKLEKLLIWIKENNLQNRFLNFDILWEENSFPLTMDELLLDSNGDIYLSMIVLEYFADKYKDLLQIWNIVDTKTLEIDKNAPKINLGLFYKILEKQSFFIDSIQLSNAFTNLLNNNK